jgi:hypothetical protein
MMRATSRNYHAFMSCTAEPGWLPEAQLQLGEWLRDRKNIDIDLSDDVLLDVENRSFRLQHHKDGQSRGLRAQLTERATDTGTWTTDLVACDRRNGDGWVSVKVENDQDRFVNIPWLARYLMQTLPLGNGRVRYEDGPQLFRQDDVEQLVALLRDEERHGLVLVAGTDDDDLPFEPFVKRMSLWTREVYGLGQVVVLDPRATRAFNAVVGPRYQAAKWGIRTFFPGVDLTSALDWRRHRILGPARLGTMEDFRVTRMLGTIARNHAASRQTPVELTRAVRTFHRLANSALLKAIDPDVAPPSPRPASPSESDIVPAAEAYLGQIDLVKAVLGVENLDESTLRAIARAAAGPRVDPAALHTARQLIQEQQDRIESLEDQLRETARALDDDQEERQQIYADLENANAENQWLRARFRERGDYEAAFGSVPEAWQEDYPESFGELLERMPSLADGRVQFTGNRDLAIDIDEYDTLQMAVRTAWEACRALEGYLRARDDGAWDKGVDPYLHHTPSGYAGITPGKHAQNETAKTMERYGDERVFPVPHEFSDSGMTVMRAHFKLARIGVVSPRMYYLDDYSRSKSIYVGYIGTHPTNTRTD